MAITIFMHLQYMYCQGFRKKEGGPPSFFEQIAFDVEKENVVRLSATPF